MAYKTLAVRPDTKRRLDEVRRLGGFSTADETISAALAELEKAKTAEAVEALAAHAGTGRKSILDEADEALVGLEETVRRIRKGVKTRLGRNARA